MDDPADEPEVLHLGPTPPELLPGRTALEIRERGGTGQTVALVALIAIFVGRSALGLTGTDVAVLLVVPLAAALWWAWMEVQVARRRREEAAAGYSTTAKARLPDLWVLDREGLPRFEPGLLELVLHRRRLAVGEAMAAERAVGGGPAAGAAPAADAAPSAGAPVDGRLDELIEVVYEGIAHLAGDDDRQYVTLTAEGGGNRFVQFALLDDGWMVGEVVSRRYLEPEAWPLLKDDVLVALGYREEPDGNYTQDFWPDRSLEEIATIAAQALVDGLGVPPTARLVLTEG